MMGGVTAHNRENFTCETPPNITRWQKNHDQNHLQISRGCKLYHDCKTQYRHRERIRTPPNKSPQHFLTQQFFSIFKTDFVAFHSQQDPSKTEKNESRQGHRRVEDPAIGGTAVRQKLQHGDKENEVEEWTSTNLFPSKLEINAEAGSDKMGLRKENKNQKEEG